MRVEGSRRAAAPCLPPPPAATPAPPGSPATFPHCLSTLPATTPPRPSADLLSLTDELLLAILHRCGAPAVARCATLCKRLRALQSNLAGLPAFASAATIEDAEDQ